MATNTIILITREQQEFYEKIKALNLPDAEIVVPESDEEIKEKIGKANIILGNPEVTKYWINDATNLQWMQSTFAGVDSMNGEDLRKDYLLTNVKDVYGKVMAEYAFGYILKFEKEIEENRAYQKEKLWERRLTNVLSEKTLGIAGTGSIGKDIADIGQSFNMRVLGYSYSGKAAEQFDQVYSRDNFHQFLGECDYVVSVLPNTQATNDLFDSPAFAAMKDTAVFINVGRGNAVDEAALIEALNQGQIKKAVLDVMKTEPLPADSPLWTHERVYLTPHMSGNYVSDALIDIFAENYRRFQAGEELQYLVDLEKGY